MPAGFQCIGDSFIYQVDESTPNLALVQKLAISTVAMPTSPIFPDPIIGSWYNHEIAITDPVIAVWSSSNFVSIAGAQMSGSNWIFTIRSLGPPGTYVEFFAFGRVGLSGANVGRQVFNGNGALVYDSNNKYFRFREQLGGDFVNANTSVAYDAGRKYAACFSGQLGTSLFAQEGNSYRLRNTSVMAQSYLGGIYIRDAIIFNQRTFVQYPPASYKYTTGSIMICDVTNY